MLNPFVDTRNIDETPKNRKCNTCYRYGVNSIWLLYPFATSNVLKWNTQLFSIQSLLRLYFYKIRSFWLLRWFEFIQSTIYPSTNLWNWFFLNENINENRIIILLLPIFNIAPYTIQYQHITKNLLCMFFVNVYDENERIDTTINNCIKKNTKELNF